MVAPAFAEDRVPVGAGRADFEHDVPDHRRGRVLPDAAGLVGRRPGHRGAHRAAPQGGAGLRPRGVCRRERSFPSADGTLVPATILRHVDTPLDGSAPCAAVRLRRLRGGLSRPGVGPGDPEPARPRRGLRARPRPRGRGRWPALVAGRADGAQAAHLRRPRRGRRRAGRGGLVDGARHRHPRTQRRRAAPGCGVLPAARPLACRGRRGPVRRRTHHDARPDDPADRQRVGRVGRPEPARGLRRGCPPTRRTTTCRRPVAVPTCSSPAPSTTRG